MFVKRKKNMIKMEQAGRIYLKHLAPRIEKLLTI